MSQPNERCPSYFRRYTARTRTRKLLDALHDLHLSSRHHYYAPPLQQDSPRSWDGSAHNHGQAARGPGHAEAGGISLEFLTAVCQHVPGTLTLSLLSEAILAPAARAHKSSTFLQIPGLVHSRYLGPPDLVVACCPWRTTLQELLAALTDHAKQHAAAWQGRRPTYWVECFAAVQHAGSNQGYAQRIHSAMLAAKSARQALVLLDSDATVLNLAWPLVDVFWTVKQRGSEALVMKTYGKASHEQLQPHVAATAQTFDLSHCQLPGSADHHHQRQQLLSGLHAKGVSLQVFNAFMRGALAASALQREVPPSPSTPPSATPQLPRPPSLPPPASPRPVPRLESKGSSTLEAGASQQDAQHSTQSQQKSGADVQHVPQRPGSQPSSSSASSSILAPSSNNPLADLPPIPAVMAAPERVKTPATEASVPDLQLSTPRTSRPAERPASDSGQAARLLLSPFSTKDQQRAVATPDLSARHHQPPVLRVGSFAESAGTTPGPLTSLATSKSKANVGPIDPGDFEIVDMDLTGRAASKPAGHVSKCAVSLDWLVNTFLDENPRVNGFTTQEVMTQIVKPRTAAGKMRYVEWLLQQGDAHRDVVSGGKQYYFISHGWARPFMELLDMLRQHFSLEQQRLWRRGQPPLAWCQVYIWLDVFAINQHPGVSQMNDLAALREVVQDAEQTLMILDKQGAVLTRIWCLYEAWQTGRKGKGSLAMLAYGTKFEPLEKVFLHLDVSKAQATNQEDLHRILAEIETDVGVTPMTHDLKDALVDSVVAETPDEDQPKEEWDRDGADKLAKAGRLCKLYGRLEQAERLTRRALEVKQYVMGDDHPDTLTALDNLALILKEQGRLADSEPLFRKVLASKEKVHGRNDPNTLRSVNNLALLLQEQGKLPEAEVLQRRALEAKEQRNGPGHRDTLTSLHNLASLLKAQGKLDEASSLCQRALDARVSLLGPDHPHTLASAHLMASVHKDLGRTEEAEAIFTRVMKMREKIFGPDNPTTLVSVNALALLLKDQNRLPEAESLARRCLEARRRVLGDDHPHTLVSLSALSSIMHENGQHQQALPLCQSAFEARRRVLGVAHPDTCGSMGNLALLLKDMGQYEEAESYAVSALEGRQRLLGLHHPHTQASLKTALDILQTQGKVAEAEALIKRTEEASKGLLDDQTPRTMKATGELQALLSAASQALGDNLVAAALSARPLQAAGGQHGEGADGPAAGARDLTPVVEDVQAGEGASEAAEAALEAADAPGADGAPEANGATEADDAPEANGAPDALQEALPVMEDGEGADIQAGSQAGGGGGGDKGGGSEAGDGAPEEEGARADDIRAGGLTDEGATIGHAEPVGSVSEENGADGQTPEAKSVHGEEAVGGDALPASMAADEADAEQEGQGGHAAEAAEPGIDL